MAEVNAFLRAHRILSVDRHFVQDGTNSVWAICVSYLDDANQPLARPARSARRSITGKCYPRRISRCSPSSAICAKSWPKREGIPAYALFTNEQLAEMVQRRVGTLNAMKEIEGVGNSPGSRSTAPNSSLCSRPRKFQRATVREAPTMPDPVDRFASVIASAAKQSSLKSLNLPLDRHGAFGASR